MGWIRKSGERGALGESGGRKRRLVEEQGGFGALGDVGGLDTYQVVQ